MSPTYSMAFIILKKNFANQRQAEKNGASAPVALHWTDLGHCTREQVADFGRHAGKLLFCKELLFKRVDEQFRGRWAKGCVQARDILYANSG